jgi:hypothetical protein
VFNLEPIAGKVDEQLPDNRAPDRVQVGVLLERIQETAETFAKAFIAAAGQAGLPAGRLQDSVDR